MPYCLLRKSRFKSPEQQFWQSEAIGFLVG